ncbi:MAG: hypothetical protein LBJ15_22380 [Comamonas sp.]|jgi:hypothetical protein|uniref:hypothetical protein n=1 Tax=Comamonas sp. TaxID=34028 RepID=UPI002824149C|nr:hypothetical protein [Comamonas sp.]MDR0216732.1 hypothetical protein [Comamonas sp.]
MAATTWRMTGIDTFGGDLELSELRLWGAAEALDVGAMLTCSHAPMAGALESLRDGDPATSCRWSLADVRSPGFFIQWVMQAAVDFGSMRLGLVRSQTSPVALRLEYLKAGQFLVFNEFKGVSTAPAPGEVTLGEIRLGTAEQGFILSAAAGTSVETPQFNSANTSHPAWAENFQQTIDIGLFGFKGTDPGDTGVLPTKTIPQFSLYDTLYIRGLNGTYSPDYADMDMEFLRSDGGVVAAVRTRWRSAYSLQMFYGSSLATLTAAGTIGSYPWADGALTFTATAMQWVPNATQTNNQAAWSFNADFSSVIAIRFSNVRATSSYPGVGAAYIAVRRTSVSIKQGYTGVLPYSPVQLQSLLSLPSEVSPMPQGLQGIRSNGITKLLDAEFGGQGRIYGTVSRKLTPTNAPLSRRVRLHRSVDGYLARETWSNADGSYEFRDISTRYEWDVIAFDHELQEFSTVANNQLAEAIP